MKYNKINKGFAPIIIIIVLLIAAAVGTGSYVVIRSNIQSNKPVSLSGDIGGKIVEQSGAGSLESEEPPKEVNQPVIQKVTYLEPGFADGTGNYFDLRYQNQGIVMQTSAIVNAKIDIMTGLVLIKVKSSQSKKTDFTIMYLEPSKTYYKYIDSYANLEEIRTDASGSVTFYQDTSSAHLIMIQPEKS